jgi:phage terminase large subunit-like protein
MQAIIINLIREIEAEQLKRLGGDNLSRYNKGKKVHKKQLLFHKCRKRNRWVFGGNRSGKTECGAAETVYIAREIHPYRRNLEQATGWVVSLSTQVQRDVAQAKLLYYLKKDWIADIVMLSGKKGSPQYGIIDYILVKNVSGKLSKIGFKSCDQGREKFQGTSLDFVWFDEEPPQDIYEECRMRVFDRGGCIYGTMTPLKGLTWVYEQIYLNPANDKDIWHITMEWADNPFLSKSEIKSLSANLSEENLQSRRYGRFCSGKGLVYPEFDPSVHVIAPFNVPHSWQDNISIDPGLNNPLSCHWYAVDYDGNVYVVAEHYEAGKDVTYHSAKIKEISDRLGWKRDSGGTICALIDSAAGQRTLAASKSVAELFYDCGINVNTRVNKDIFAGISRVKAYLKNAEGGTKLYIFKNCVNMIREIKSYFWGEGDVPQKKDDHAMDDLRYYIMSKPEPAKPAARQLTPIQLDIKKRIRRNKMRADL